MSLLFFVAIPISLFGFGWVKYKRAWVVVLIAYAVSILLLFAAAQGHAWGLIYEPPYVVFRILVFDPLLGILASFLIVRLYRKFRRKESIENQH